MSRWAYDAVVPDKSRAVLAVAFAASLFGLTGTVAASGPDDLAPFAAGVWRSIVGGIALIAVAIVSGERVWRYNLINRWVAVGALGVAVYQIAFFEAIDRTGVALGTLVAIASGPPIAGLLDALVQRCRPSRTWLLGTAVAVAGVAVLSFGSTDVDAVGIGLAVVAGTSFPLFGLAAQRLMLDRPFVVSMATVFGFGAVLLAPAAVITLGDVVRSFDATLTVSTLGVVTLTLAYWLWGLGLDRLSLSVVVTVTLVEPAVAALLAVVVLNEPFTVALVAGVVLVALGVRLGSLETTAASTSK